MDNSLYQSMAIDLVRYHKLPYIGTWDQNFPGIILFHSAAILAFGTSEIGYRALDVLLQIGFCLILYRLWSLWLPKETAWLAVFLYVCYYVRSGYDVEGQRDAYGILLFLIAAYLLFRRLQQKNIHSSTLIVAGLILGIAVLIRPTFIVYGFFIVCTMPTLRTWAKGTLFLLFALVPLGLSYIFYSFIPGGLQQYWLATVSFNADLYTTFGAPLSHLLRWTIIPMFITLPAIVGVLPVSPSASVSTRHPKRNLKLLYALCLGFAILSAIVQRKYLQYHFAPWMIFLTPLAAIGFQRIMHLFSKPRIVFYTILAALIALTLPKNAVMRSLKDPIHAQEIFGEQAMIAKGMKYRSEQSVVSYLNQPQNKEGAVEICSFNARLRADLARPNAGRYPSLHGIGMMTDTLNPHAFTSYQLLWRKSYMDSLVSIRPRFIVLARATDAWYLRDPYTDLLHNLEGFDSLLFTRYRLDTIIGTFQIYRLRCDNQLRHE
ncbi:MAG TPA: glycosyltransferase family 39 protein [Candidatus Kapabacteria bacterium]|nr:glycosyltransferase family 39 protein [Candidatus Kapabacteria bacterium]